MCIFSWIGQQILIVWDFICMVWDWVNSNSGAIQVVIGIIALAFAVMGYKGLLQQLLLSNKQEYVANKQRFFDLKIRVYCVLSENNSLCRTSITRYKKVIHDYEYILNEYKKNPKWENRAERIVKMIESLRRQEDKIKKIEERIKKLLSKIKGIEFSNPQASEKFLMEVLSLNSQLTNIAHLPDRLEVYIARHKKKLSLD